MPRPGLRDKVPAPVGAVNDGRPTALARRMAYAVWIGWTAHRRRILPDNREKPDQTALFARISGVGRPAMAGGPEYNIATHIHLPSNRSVSYGYLTSCRARRRRRQLLCLDLRGRHA